MTALSESVDLGAPRAHRRPTIDNPPANALSHPRAEGAEGRNRAARADPAVGAIVIPRGRVSVHRWRDQADSASRPERPGMTMAPTAGSALAAPIPSFSPSARGAQRIGGRVVDGEDGDAPVAREIDGLDSAVMVGLLARRGRLEESADRTAVVMR